MLAKDLLTGWNVVVLDDEEDSLELVELILLEYGATVYTAMNGETGIKVVREVRPRLVISDLSMPKMNGWDFIKAMKAERELAEIPVIALTAHAMLGDRERAIAAGFHNYLTKPLTASTFITDLVKLLVDIPILAPYLSVQ